MRKQGIHTHSIIIIIVRAITRFLALITHGNKHIIIILGDVDDDGEVGVIDATYIQRYEAGFNIPISEEDILLRGDVDGDEEVTVVDATYIQRYDAGFSTPYPIGEAI